MSSLFLRSILIFVPCKYACATTQKCLYSYSSFTLSQWRIITWIWNAIIHLAANVAQIFLFGPHICTHTHKKIKLSAILFHSQSKCTINIKQVPFNCISWNSIDVCQYQVSTRAINLNAMPVFIETCFRSTTTTWLIINQYECYMYNISFLLIIIA